MSAPSASSSSSPVRRVFPVQFPGLHTGLEKVSNMPELTQPRITGMGCATACLVLLLPAGCKATMARSLARKTDPKQADPWSEAAADGEERMIGDGET